MKVKTTRERDIGDEEAPSVQDVTVTTECSSRIVGSEAHHLNVVHADILIDLKGELSNQRFSDASK
ncbi:unnamed protein product [Sphenostylis stenocarpa]|uniref:Uncharacterized protein n=1 Tax=Sphenostylis stenocarpa TaxID=92480 RepID=A0AA86W2P8_9FABA|nr:unnamed protein product [Sphenostylis stenocarpa]